MALPSRVKIVEVGPRDGLQNEPGRVPADVKIGLIERLAAAGVRVIESGSFVSPRWVPQMADTDRVFAGVRRREGVAYTALVPNRKGLEAALACGVEEVAVFAAATETFSRRNTNCSVAEGLERCRDVATAALAAGVRVRGYISVVLGCPYEGDVDPAAVVAVARALDAMGCYEVSLGDTIGTGTPGKMRALVEACSAHVPVTRLAVHCHDTYGQALANCYAALEAGVAVIDASVAGLGGCPYAKGATGNVATEDVVYMLHGLGIETGIDLDQLVDAGQYICAFLGRPGNSKAARAITAKRAA
ncbi:MAG: hydroxymethylglutaryl-CoA lyase [Pseudomonadota bacterium]